LGNLLLGENFGDVLAAGEDLDGDDFKGENFDGELLGEALLEGDLWEEVGTSCSIVSDEETEVFLCPNTVLGPVVALFALDVEFNGRDNDEVPCWVEEAGIGRML
jgi:hypothetical protein